MVPRRMRPSVEVPDVSMYECPDCGARVTDVESDRCDCGGELLNLNRSRDL